MLESRGAGLRNALVVMYSMYAWVRDAVELRSGARWSAVRRGGVREAVRPSGVIGMVVKGYL
jgi:hypothetical protein